MFFFPGGWEDEVSKHLAGLAAAASHSGGVHSHGVTPIAGWFTMENPIKIAVFGGTHILGRPHIIHATFCEVSRKKHMKKHACQEPSCDASAPVVGP